MNKSLKFNKKHILQSVKRTFKLANKRGNMNKKIELNKALIFLKSKNEPKELKKRLDEIKNLSWVKYMSTAYSHMKLNLIY